MEESLQSRFERFRTDKLREKASRSVDRDADFESKMRDKFIAACRKYDGVPYHRRYWPSDSPEAERGLFLDCCGLIRQVLRDLPSPPHHTHKHICSIPLQQKQTTNTAPGVGCHQTLTRQVHNDIIQRHQTYHIRHHTTLYLDSPALYLHNAILAAKPSHSVIIPPQYHKSTLHFRSTRPTP